MHKTQYSRSYIDSTLTRTTIAQINGTHESQVRQKRSYHVQYHLENICTDLSSVMVELVEFVCVDPSSLVSSSLELDKTNGQAHNEYIKCSTCYVTVPVILYVMGSKSITEQMRVIMTVCTR